MKEHFQEQTGYILKGFKCLVSGEEDWSHFVSNNMTLIYCWLQLRSLMKGDW